MDGMECVLTSKVKHLSMHFDGFRVDEGSAGDELGIVQFAASLSVQVATCCVVSTLRRVHFIFVGRLH